MKNPKTKAGLAALLALLALGAVLLIQMIPTISETRREMSLTPTPLPAMPASVRLVTPDPAAPTPEPVLRAGAQGQMVTDLQSRLAALGYDPGEIDGQFGAGTKEAVMRFQRRNDLEVDGLVGPDTRQLLFSAEAKPWAEEADQAGTEENAAAGDQPENGEQ